MSVDFIMDTFNLQLYFIIYKMRIQYFITCTVYPIKEETKFMRKQFWKYRHNNLDQIML